MGKSAANGQRGNDRTEIDRARQRAAAGTAPILTAVRTRSALALLSALWLACASSLAHATPLTAGFPASAARAIFPSASALSSQTITFPAIGNKTYGVAPFAVTAAASSSLPVSLASLTVPVCTVSSSTVTVLAAGTCTIQATQPGDTTYAAAPSVSRSFTVAKATQTITFPAISGKTFGAASFRVVATASSGLGVPLASTTASVCTLAGPMLNIIAAGTCSIQASQAGDGNYNAAASITRTFTVAQASQTIAFAAPSAKTFGDPPFNVSATATSGLPVSFFSTTTGVCSIGGTTITMVAAGTCTIQAMQAGDANHKPAASVNRSFNVAKASQTITFGGLSAATFGVPPFDVSASASSGLPVGFASTTSAVCTVSAHTVTIIGGGTCTIRASQPGNGNYAAAANVNQSFTVAKASQTISFAPLSPATVGAPPFVVSATASSGLPVSFASTTTSVCTVSGATVTIIAAGTCTVRASQSGNSGYAAAPNVSQSFAVAKVAQTITFAPLIDRLLGGAPFTVSATSSSGLVVTFASTTTTVCTVSATTVTIVAIGTCTIRASQAGNSTYSAAPSVNQSFAVTNALQSQTISFGPLSNQTFGAAPFTISATASSALSVSFASLTPPVCAVSGSTVTLLGAGTCTIQASQAGNASYSPAPNVNQSFTVAKGAQTISFGALGSQILGAAPFAVGATTSSGLPVSFASLTASVCTISGSIVTLVSAGTCTIQASQAGNANYAAAPNVSQSFAVTIVLQAQTITFGALSNQIFGAAPFTVSATASSALPVGFVSLTTPVCTVSGSSVTLLSAGICTIQASQAGNAAYAPAPNVSQSFTVTRAAQTISFGALGSQVLGAAPFTVSATASSGLPVSFASLTLAVCTVSASTVTLVSAGTCTIQGSQAGNANYAAAPNVNQSFAVTIVLQAQTITFGTLSNQIFGTAPFTVSATASSALPVGFASLTTPVCTVSGSSVTVLSAGTCTIQASQAGNATYAAAPTVNQSFTVTQAAQTISFAALGSQILGVSPFTLSATASSGLSVSFASLTSTTCTVSGSTVTLLNAGTCTLQASQAGNVNYASAPNVNQSFSVTQPGQTISFVPSAAYATGTFPNVIALGDFNGDGIADMAVANAFSGNVTILIGHADGTFTPGTPVTTGGEPVTVAVGDFNGDGKLDLAVCDFASGTVVIFAGNGNGTFTRVGSFGAGLFPNGIAVADVNHDGNADLVVANNTSGGTTGQTVNVLLGNGDGSFRAPVAYPTGTTPYAVVVADFNGDGNPDLAVANGDSNSVSILLGNGDGTFAAAVNYAAGATPDGLAIGDFNGDGKLDLAVVNDFSGNVSIFLGRGDGTFSPATNFATGSGSASVAVADFNGDGRADLAIVNRFDNTMVLLLGNGDGTFQAPLTYSVGGQPSAIVAQDLNGDGRPDLVMASDANNNVSVLLQTTGVPATLSVQAGSPQSAPVGSAYATPFAVLVRDAGGHPLQGVSVTFTAPLTGASGTFGGGAAAALAVSNASGVATAPTFTANASTGSFAVIAAVAALNATFALSNTIAGPAPLFTSGPPPNGTVNASYSFTIAASGTPAPSFSVLPNSLPTGLSLNGTSGLIAGMPSVQGTFAGMFTATNGMPPDATQAFAITVAGLGQTITFGALSNQTLGAPPLTLSATASSGLPVSFLSQTPAVCSVVGVQVTLLATGTCTIRAVQAGNVSYGAAPNVDQTFTITAPLASQTITFNALANQALGAAPLTVSAVSSSGLPVSFSSLTAAVCTVSAATVTLVAGGTCTIRASQAGNGTYAAAPNVDQSFSVTVNAGTINFAAAVNYATGNNPWGVAIADFNLDGKADLAVVNENGTSVSVLFGNGDGTFVPGVTLATGGAPTQIVVADFNGDGKPDLAVTNILGNSVTVYLGNGNGTFGAPHTVIAGLAPFGLAAADLNGDGKIDLVVANGSSGSTVGQTVSVLLGNGDGTFQSPVAYATGTNPFAVAIADFNGDGKLDLAVTSSTNNSVSILLGNGDGTFRPQVAYAAGVFPRALSVADFNGDGKPDLAVLNRTGNNVSILIGNGDGTFAAATNYAVGSTPETMTTGDFNGDGIVDIVATNYFNNVIVVLQGNGDGTFKPAISFPVGAQPDGLAAGDLNGDGRLDLVVSNSGSNTVSVLLNGTSGAPASIVALTGTPQSALVSTIYATTLSAVVRDASNAGIAGATVTFTAPASGASGTFQGGTNSIGVTTNTSGVATAPMFTANAVAGAFAVTASISGSSASFALTNTATTQAPVFTSSAPPGGQFGAVYSYQLTTSGVPPPIFAVNSGALPPGLALAAGTGVIGGTPTSTGTFSGVITASNSISPPATQAFSIVIAQGNQTITFTPPGNQILFTPAFNLTATASSGLAVTFLSLTTSVCAVNGSSVSLAFVGTCTIRASQSGNANYAAAPNVDRSFTVSTTQTITFGALVNKTFTDPPFTVSATATSGLPVTFSSLTTSVCTVGGNTVTLLAAGTCTIRASQAGNDSYFQAPNVDQSFTVHASLGAQTITFATLGNQAFASPPFTITAASSSGLPVTFASLTTGACQVFANTITVIAVGTCTIRASQAGNVDYAAAPDVDNTFSVVSASQTIAFPTMDNPVLGGQPVELHATASSGLIVSFTSLTPTVCGVYSDRVTLQLAGTCTIRASQSGNANFVAAPDVDLNLTITPEFQTLVFLQPTDQSLIFPQLLPQASASSGLPVTFSTLTPTVCTGGGSVVTLVAVGTCTVVATQAGNANYAAVSVQRSFAVTAATFTPPTTIIPGPSVEYYSLLGGDQNPFGGSDKAFDVVVGADGSAWVGGSAAGTSFPQLSSATFTNSGLDLLYVAKMNPTRGNVDLATVVGARSASMTGTGQNAYVGADQVEAMAIGGDGAIYVAAYANSVKYPVTGGTYARTGPKTLYRVGSDGGVQALAAVVDPAVQTIRALTVDSAGGIYFAGAAGAGLVTSASAAIATGSAPAGGPYLIKLAPGGATTAYATYLSVPGSRPSSPTDPSKATIDTATTPYAIAVDAAGNAYLTGQAKANDFPVTPGAPDTSDSASRDAFVAKINPTGSAFVWVARLGGTDAERATSIALSPDGGVVIGGKSATYPLLGTIGAFQTVIPFLPNTATVEREIGFIAKLAGDGSHWQFLLPIGTANGNLVGHEDLLNASPCCDVIPVKIAVDATGAIYATGSTGPNRRLPVAGPQDIFGIFAAIQSPSYDADAPPYSTGAFLMKISADASQLAYSVIIGDGTPTGLALDAYGAVYVAGYGASPRSPLTNSGQAAPGSVFIAKIVSQSAPVILGTSPNPAAAANNVTLTANLGDARYAGSIEFREGAQSLATVPVAGGAATFTTTFATGIHRLSAIFHGSGPFDGFATAEVIQVINQ